MAEVAWRSAHIVACSPVVGDGLVWYFVLAVFARWQILRQSGAEQGPVACKIGDLQSRLHGPVCRTRLKLAYGIQDRVVAAT